MGSRQRSRREDGQVRESSAGTESQDTVLVIKGPCTPGHHQNRSRHLRAGTPSSPHPHPSPPASVRELLCGKLLPHPERGWALRPDPILLLRGEPWGPYHHQHTHHTTHQTDEWAPWGCEACDEDEMVCEGSGQCWLTGERWSYQLTLCKEDC